jgi:hypothetical protein
MSISNPHRLGTSAWAARRGGILNWRERLQMASATALAQLKLAVQAGQSLTAVQQSRLDEVNIDTLRLPDSRVVADAAEVLNSLATPWVEAHSMRTWAWASLLARRDGLQPDQEALAVACLMHDTALLDTGVPARGGCACFAAAGARHARGLIQRHGWPSERQQVVDEAICLHMNPVVAVSEGVEAHLLHEAAAMDVVGARLSQISMDWRRAVTARHPRQGFEARMAEAMGAQARRAPWSRTGLLWKLGFERAILHSPWTTPGSSTPV